ncbi:hypothetical protein Clacol_004779 [Clathrus columnatus]|uniref:Exocyst complex component Sec10 n=1 Tax=Clathrus columnatus TaxID=1419009 RepID=A0AAV5AA18_9AGAM|nr:hypothetical protein Clacol_004779 [Clathrus columnatus]
MLLGSLLAPLRQALYSSIYNHVQFRGRAQLAPKAVKYMKRHKGKLPIPIGGSTKGTTLAYGDYGIRIRGNGLRFSAKQLTTAQDVLKRKLKGIKNAKIYLRLFPDVPVCVKGNETRMGKGKGAFEFWATRAAPGRVIFEIGTPSGTLPIREELAREGDYICHPQGGFANPFPALRQASDKLPCTTEFITKYTPPRLGSLDILPELPNVSDKDDLHGFDLINNLILAFTAVDTHFQLVCPQLEPFQLSFRNGKRSILEPANFDCYNPATTWRLMSSTFKLDPSVEEDKFDVKDFVSSISEKLIVQSKAQPGPFDPKPFIQTFETAIDILLDIRKEVQRQTDGLERSVKPAQRDYSKKMNELHGGFEAVSKSFSAMEANISDVGGTAARIGEQLESVHVSRQRAQAAHDLIDYYNQFSKGDTTRLDNLQKEGGKEGRQQVAVILRRLNILAKEVDIPSAEKARENIDKYCEKFEKSMLRLFDRFYRKGDPKMMHHCAQTLLDFNGGASCVQIYVNQHDFFISGSRVQELIQVDSGRMWDSISDPEVSPPKREPGIEALFEEIRTTVAQEAEIVQAVFPNPPMVMQVFLQRVFAQSIQQYLEVLFNKASNISQLSFLRMLNLAHSKTLALVESLKAYDLAHVTARLASDRAASDNLATTSGPGQVVSVATMLETATDELFMPYIEGQKYLERESKSLAELYSNLLYKFNRYHESVSRTKGVNLINRVVNQITTTTASTSATTSATTAQSSALKILGFGATATTAVTAEKEKPTEEILREEDGRPNLEVSEKMLKWHAEAVGRCVELNSTSEIPKNVFALMRVLAEALGQSYVEAALEVALTRLELRDSKLEPDLSPLTVIRTMDMICHLWQQYVNIALMPLAGSSVTVRREMLIFNNQTINRIEGTTNSLLQKMADAIVAWLGLQLSKQKRNDFKPRNDDLSFARVNTEPCGACCDLLEKVKDVAKVNLSGKNLETFLMEIGVAFHALLLDHLKKFPVSATGGLMLAKDLKSYQDIITSFRLPILSERFEFIKELGNLFLIQPEILRTYIRENNLGRIEPILLRPYLAQRADWNKEEKMFEGFFGDEETESAKGLKDRLGVSRMMRELESLRIGDGPTSFSTGFSFIN